MRVHFAALFLFALLLVLCHAKRPQILSQNNSPNANVPVFVMMPLDLVTNEGKLKNPTALYQQLQKLKSGGTDGIMVDVWWGIVESKSPKNYDFTAYRAVADMCKQLHLQMQVVISFHKCGTNVGDECFIQLPSWVRDVGSKNPDIYYTDRGLYRDDEYLSLGVDNEPLFNGRSAVGMYTDFMSAFAREFAGYMPETIVTVEVGLGPAGELRYPSYQLQQSRWRFPGIGEYQCYDKYMLASLAKHAAQMGRPEWGHGGPSNAGNYNNKPGETGFFSSSNNKNRTIYSNEKSNLKDSNSDNWNSEYGKFFQSWYSSMLLQHAENVLSKASTVFASKGITLAAKISGIHWWYLTDSHAAELTAGYYNVAYHDGYKDIATLFKKYNVEFQFTCLEMRNSGQQGCQCGPENLVAQTRNNAWNQGIKYAGENALPIFDDYNYNQVIAQSASGGRTISSFTYLRMCDHLFTNGPWTSFVNFVNRMHNL